MRFPGLRFPGAVGAFLVVALALLASSALPMAAQDQTPPSMQTQSTLPGTPQPQSSQPQPTPDQLPAPVPYNMRKPTRDQMPASVPDWGKQSPEQLSRPQQEIHFRNPEPFKSISAFSSPYIPLDSWIYPAMMRLYSMGFVDTEFLGLRPWTQLSVANMLDQSWGKITDSKNDDAIEIYYAVERELQPYLRIPMDHRFGRTAVESVYTRAMGIAGLPLRDSFHLGQTDINDYGRPYAGGFNSYSGFSGSGEYGRFSMYFRGEYQHAPSWAGYPQSLANLLARIDDFATDTSVPLPGNTTIPLGPIASVNNLTVLEGYVSAHLAGHEISLGKMDTWYGPAAGGGMAWSNNAENVYSFRINRIEPLYIPYVSRIVGLIRYDFFVGPLKGHNDPVSPWVHAEKIMFKTTPNFEFGFERTVIWGGIGHQPVTLGTFWHSFYSISDTTGAEKFSRNDPGARFSAIDFAWRLPFVEKWLTLYSDTETHDDVFPISAPRRAAYRPGLYLSHIPGAPKWDLRGEAASTAPNNGQANGGQFMYIEVVQRNGYTNNGQLMGDWIGREDKAAQGWLTYHRSPQEWLQFTYRRDQATRDFIPGGTSQNDFGFEAVKRFGPDVEARANLQYEYWKIPIYKPGLHSNTSFTFKLTWFPKIEQRF